MFRSRVESMNFSVDEACEAFLLAQGMAENIPLRIHPGSISDRVLSCIRQCDGIRGYEIIALVGHTSDLTVRTALTRLHRRRMIEKRGVKWYPVNEEKVR